MTTSGYPQSRLLAADSHNLAWMINEFAKETSGVMHAVLLAVDGLAIAASDGLDHDQVDKLAATAGSLMSIANAISHEYGTSSPEILMFRTANMHFLFMNVADRAGLAVLADRDSNLGVVGHHMQRLVTAVGTRLDPGARPSPVSQPAAPSNH